MVEFNPENKLIIQPNANITSGGGTPVPNSNNQSVSPNSIIINNEVTTNTQNLNSIYTTNPQTTTQTQPEQPNEQPFIKTGESLSERLDRYYSGKYSKSNLEQKRELLRRYMTGHFQALTNKTPAERIRIQLADYKKLLSNTEEPQDYRVLANQIEILESQNQIPGARSAIEQARNPEFRRNAEIGISEVISDCDSENRSELTRIIVNSDNFEAYESGLNNLEQVHGEQQIQLYEIYSIKVSRDFNTYTQQNTAENQVTQGPLTQDVANSFKPWQWANMTVEQRNNIQDVSMSNDPNARLNALENGVNSQDPGYAQTFGGFGYKIQPEYQQEASVIIVNTHNIDVINAAADTLPLYTPENQALVHKNYFTNGDITTEHILTSHIGECDINAQLPIYELTMTSTHQETLNYAASLIYTLHPDNQYNATQYTINTGNEEAIGYAAQYANLCNEEVRDEIKNLLYSTGYQSVRYILAYSDTTEEEGKTTTNTSSSSSTNNDEFKKAKLSEKIKIIEKLSKSNNETSIKDLLKNATNAEKIAIISQLPKNILASVVNVIMDSNPSADVMYKITSMMGNMNDKEQTKLVGNLISRSSSSLLANNVKFLNVISQKIFIEKMAAKGNLSAINKDDLHLSAKKHYTDLTT